MDGLKTTRVLVIDDDVAEATLFMEALAQHGIGSIRFSGEVEKLPTENNKLTGIRLAVIDMDLDGAGDDVNVVIPRLLGIMGRLIAKDNGPYLAVAWTKHDDYVDSFRERCPCELDCPPIRIIPMPKQSFTDIESISHKVDQEIGESYPLGLLGFWEQTIHKSSGSVMKILPNTTDWVDQSKKSLRLLLNSAAHRKDSSAVKLISLMATLNSLQFDAIETIVAAEEDATAKSLISPLNGVKLSKKDGPLRSTLNYRLLCTDVAPGAAPGNIYTCDGICSGETSVFPALNELIADAANPDKPTSRQELECAGCLSIAMEITPLCDYQQRARGIPRFICGLAVPEDKEKFLKERAHFLRRMDPITFESPPLAGTRLLVWNSHYVVTVPNSLVESDVALLRLRPAPLIDVQAWLGGQGNRPGYLSVR